MPSPTTSGAPRIMVAEDDEQIGSVIVRHLRMHGFDPVLVSTGREAIQLLDTTSFALVITDLYMPGADGFEILHRIRAACGAPPVILITGAGPAEEHFIEMASALGAVATLRKPFAMTELAELVRTFVASRRSANSEEDQRPAP